jgi:hypothetical protein
MNQLYTTLNIIRLPAPTAPPSTRRQAEVIKITREVVWSEDAHLAFDLVYHVIEVLLGRLAVTLAGQSTVDKRMGLHSLLCRHGTQQILHRAKNTLGFISGLVVSKAAMAGSI